MIYFTLKSLDPILLDTLQLQMKQLLWCWTGDNKSIICHVNHLVTCHAFLEFSFSSSWLPSASSALVDAASHYKFHIYLLWLLHSLVSDLCSSHTLCHIPPLVWPHCIHPKKDLQHRSKVLHWLQPSPHHANLLTSQPPSLKETHDQLHSVHCQVPHSTLHIHSRII